MSGYIKLHRKIRQNPLFRKNKAAMVFFIDLLLDATWKDTVQDWRGQPVEVKRGQVMMSVREMAEEYGLSAQNVRTLVNTLKLHKMLKSNTPINKAPSVITICNYEEYQSDKQSPNKAVNDDVTKSQPTKEEVEEVKERSNRDSNESLVANRDEREVDHDLLGDDLKPAKATRTSLPIVESFNAYQETALRCGIAQARALTPAIRKSINARLKEYGPNGWADCLANIERSAFLCGHTEKSDFRVSLPWMLKPANFEKIVSGVYGNGRHAEKIPETDAASLYEKLIAGAQS